MARDIVELLSPLSLDTCRSRLAARIDSPWTYFGGRPLIGRLRGTTLRVRRRHGYRNAFQTYLTASLVDEGGRTRLRCRLGLHPAVVAFMAVWFVIVGSVTVAMTVAAVHATDPRRLPAPHSIGVPLIMLAFGIALVFIARHLGRGDRDDLLAIVGETVQATRVSPPLR